MLMKTAISSADVEIRLTNGEPHLIRRDARHFEWVGWNIGERFLITVDPANGDEIDVVLLSGDAEQSDSDRQG